MSFKKKMLAFAAVGALTAATAVPAMAFENEFHGMYRVFGFASNAETGGGTFNLQDGAKKTFYAEQRARLMYIAKANDHLKLVTHFELDTRFGGQDTANNATGTLNNLGGSNKYPIGDSGALDADRLILEMKNVYLDFDIPQTPVNAKVGVQPFNDAFQGIFGNIDAAGVLTSAKLGSFTPTLGWFRLADNNFYNKGVTTIAAPTAANPGNTNATNGATSIMPGTQTEDMLVVDGKYAVNKDLNVGASYYFVEQDKGAATTIAIQMPGFKRLHMLGANADAKVGPVALSAFAAYQFGDKSVTQELSAFAGSAMAKIAVGPGKFNLTGLYLSGDKAANNPGANAGAYKGFQQLASSGNVSYFAPANMWLLVRNSSTINSATSIGGLDLTKGGAGLLGLFGGYDATFGKLFASANVGYGQVAQKGTASSNAIGTELNATVGYKVYDNLTASLTLAYLALAGGVRDPNHINTIAGPTVTNESNPYLGAVQLNYAF